MNYSEAIRDITTCDLSDGCDALGIVPVTAGAVKAVFPGCRPICGPVITCKMSPTGKGGPLTVRSEFSSIDGDCRQGSRLRRSRNPSGDRLTSGPHSGHVP